MAPELHGDVLEPLLLFFLGLHRGVGRVLLHNLALLVSLRVKHLVALALANPLGGLRALFEEMEGFSFALCHTGGLF